MLESKKLYGGMFFKGSDLESEIKNDLDLLGFNFIIIESSDFSVMVNDEGHHVHPIVENKSLKFYAYNFNTYQKLSKNKKIKYINNHKILSKYGLKNIKFFVSSSIPHTVVDWAAYYLLRFNNINCFNF